ncbi:FAD-dependent monooxygenase [Nocardia yamanashiensis]|uniref:FAD-dependent monooxygenase n=1 Tax=Nocardia yamanashiensis TaxID=209247 RepID=UPI001C3F60EB|nr:FAD-dependent monooxygenase [Nocardia yamanashiensis]
MISGAGIAGLTLAHWLRRYGFDVTVVEYAPAPRPGGQAVGLGGVAKDVATHMGVLPDIDSARAPGRGLAYVNASGKRKASIPAPLFDGEAAVAEIEILRGDLIGILYAVANEDVEYLFGDSITDILETPEGVEVTFGRNESHVFDLVVGADGLHSNVRELVFGSEAQFVHHLGAYLAFFTIPADGLELDDGFLLHNAPGGLLAAIRTEGADTAQAMLGFKAPALDYDRHDIVGQQRIVAERFSGVGWHAAHLLDSMGQAPDFYFDSLSHTRMHRWSRGRVALIGDAGYSGSPLSGNGTAMAMVGAYVLAGELARSRDDYLTAYGRYLKLLRPFVIECQKLPRGGVNGFLPSSRIAIAARNLSVRVMTSAPMRGVPAKSLQKSGSITLPDYREYASSDVSRP